MQPDYVGFETKQREELLSQFGTFSPGERDLFHALCQNWQERIPYGRFSAFLNRENGGTTSDLLSLMDKLRRNRMGLLRTAMQDGRRSREAIILTGQGSSRFYAELFDEYFTDMLESIVNPLPLASYIEKDFGEIPRDALQTVSAAKAATYFGGKATAELPLAIESFGDDALLITQKNLRAFINVSILKMRYFLNNTTLLGVLAKLQDTSLLNIKQRCGGKEPMFWLGLTKTIVERARDIEAMRAVNVDSNFFHVACLLRGLIESQIAEAEQKKQEAENRRLDLEAIALSVKEAPDGLIDQSQLSRMLEAQKEKYADRFDQFRDEFYERYVHARSRTALPKIVLLNRRYIHRDNVFPLFMQNFRVLEEELTAYFTHLMETQLKTGNREKDASFYSLDNFNESIRQEIRERNDYIAAIVDKPSVLGEAMILHAKQNKLARNVDEIKQRLSLYFDPSTMKFLPFNEWFNLRPLELFGRAFEKLPILKRIWIRLTGKYESFRGHFLGQTTSRDTTRIETPGESRADGFSTTGPRAAGVDEGRRAERVRGARHRAAAPQKSSSGSSDKQPAKGTAKVPKSYTKKQVDSAWAEFGSTIRKKD